EDGIRDFHVTGVQTCALPISSLIQKPNNERQNEVNHKTSKVLYYNAFDHIGYKHCNTQSIDCSVCLFFGIFCALMEGHITSNDRSEERRAGKAGGSRKWPHEW